MNGKDFFKDFARLYYDSSSFRRRLGILWHEYVSKGKNGIPDRFQPLSLVELLKLRIMAYPLRRKLCRQYFAKENKENHFD